MAAKKAGAAGEGLSKQDAARIGELLRGLEQKSRHFLGYPCNLAFDYSALLPLLHYPINNIGDPYHASSFRLNTHEFEREVLGIFQGLLHAPMDGIWGYVTSGGTEGNMYGIYLARELLPTGVVYYSEDTHYSVAKILRLLTARNIMIRSQPNGEIDYNDLHETLRIHRDAPPIIFANIGTTMKGAVDNVQTIRGLLRELAISNYYIHADGALSGMVLPFLDQSPIFDFRAGIDSISISGHKMVGSPIPCGVVLAKKAHVDRVKRAVEYIGTLDTTLSGSRSGLTPLFLWYALKSKGLEGYAELVRECDKLAEYTVRRMVSAGIPAWRNPHSLTVVFPRPSEQVAARWQLASHENIAHIIVMPHVAKGHIDEFIKEVVAAQVARKGGS